jgi:hypothetical protein
MLRKMLASLPKNIHEKVLANFRKMLTSSEKCRQHS